jgi:hypothetical protein
MCVQERVGTIVQLNVPFEEYRVPQVQPTFETLQVRVSCVAVVLFGTSRAVLAVARW